MLESKVQKKIADHLEKDGWFVVKLMQTNKNGIPDLLAVKPNRNLWVEVKTKKGMTRKLQEEFHQNLRCGFGQQVIVPKGWDHFLELYEMIDFKPCRHLRDNVGRTHEETQALRDTNLF